MKTDFINATVFSLVLSSLVMAPQRILADAGTTVPNTAHDCMVEPLVFAEVGSPTQGIVAGLLAERGSRVSRGQAIAQLESSIEQALLEQAQARAEMQSEVVTREADLALARLDSQRFSELHAQRLAPAQRRDEAVAREHVASAAVVQALENRKLLQLELQRTRRVLEQRTIRSPVEGVVVHHLVNPGELVYDNPIMTVAQLHPLSVEVVLPARFFGSIQVGDEARIFPELTSDVGLLAKVDVVDPLLDGRSGTFGVRLLLPNSDFSVPAGQKCRVSFPHPIQDATRASASLKEKNNADTRISGTAAPSAALPDRSDGTAR